MHSMTVWDSNSNDDSSSNDESIFSQGAGTSCVSYAPKIRCGSKIVVVTNPGVTYNPKLRHGETGGSNSAGCPFRTSFDCRLILTTATTT
jgi:hypothetical protein